MLGSIPAVMSPFKLPVETFPPPFTPFTHTVYIQPYSKIWFGLSLLLLRHRKGRKHLKGRRMTAISVIDNGKLLEFIILMVAQWKCEIHNFRK